MGQIKRVKLSEFAKNQGLAYITAYKLWKQGMLDGVQLPSGTILVSGWKHELTDTEEETTTTTSNLVVNNAVLYLRVPPHVSKEEMTERLKKLQAHAVKSNFDVIHEIIEIGYAFSSRKPKLSAIMEMDNWGVLVTERKSSLMLIGYDLLISGLALSGRKVSLADDDVVSDFNDEVLIEEFIMRTKKLMDEIIGMPSHKRPLKEIFNRFLK